MSGRGVARQRKDLCDEGWILRFKFYELNIQKGSDKTYQDFVERIYKV
jgi:hypothetical protein